MKNWFSNMLPLDKPFIYGGLSFRTVENFYQAMKAPKSDIETRQRIAMMDPYSAKRYWKKRQPRPDWGQIKLDVMEYALRIKFAQGTSWIRS